MKTRKNLSLARTALLLGTLAGISAPVLAQTVAAGPDPKTIPGNGYYISFNFGGIHRQPAQDRSGPKTEFKDGYVVGGEIGRRFGNFRVGAETNYFNNVNNKEFVPATAGSPYASLAAGEKAQGNIGLKTYFLNVYADIPTKQVRLKPYVGAGLGVFQSQVNGLSSATLQAGLPLFGIGPTVVNVSSDFQTAYQFKIGASYAVDSKTELFLGYRKLEGQRFKLATTTLGTLDVRGPNVDTIEAGIRIFL